MWPTSSDPCYCLDGDSDFFNSIQSTAEASHSVYQRFKYCLPRWQHAKWRILLPKRLRRHIRWILSVDLRVWSNIVYSFRKVNYNRTSSSINHNNKVLSRLTPTVTFYSTYSSNGSRQCSASWHISRCRSRCSSSPLSPQQTSGLRYKNAEAAVRARTAPKSVVYDLGAKLKLLIISSGVNGATMLYTQPAKCPEEGACGRPNNGSTRNTKTRISEYQDGFDTWRKLYGSR